MLVWIAKGNGMPKRKDLDGYNEARGELKRIIFEATIEAGVLLRHLRELRRELAEANRHGTILNFRQYLIDFLGTGAASSLQNLIRRTNDARKVVAQFLEKNKGSGL